MGCCGSRVQSPPPIQYSMKFKPGPQRHPFTDSWPEIDHPEPSPERLAELREPYRGNFSRPKSVPAQQVPPQPRRVTLGSGSDSSTNSRLRSSTRVSVPPQPRRVTLGSGSDSSTNSRLRSSSRVSVPPGAFTPPHPRTVPRPAPSLRSPSASSISSSSTTFVPARAYWKK
ncbi:hypothetical protein AK830_g6853 [Neonectria ditissima]|uniref:Uncharacterized protein n=1 Tax=Neonectria ditissima TaxID=78410 RepID=A0A0P7BBG5_9HYPO|nr:hypothetical protein AK830_g6853 [Neonectria ditissima]